MRILICPLNWGLGHSTRCIPIIERLQNEGHEIILASDGYPYRLLKNRFPLLNHIILPSYKVKYSKKKSQVLAMFFNLPRIITGSIKEHFWLKKFIDTNGIDWVISDNRFGLWNKRIHSTYITHQLMIKMPETLTFLESLAWRIHRFIILRYNECWIPDYATAEANLSGDLSHKYPLPENGKFIGPLSRFKLVEPRKTESSFDVIALLSGLEPHRSIFQQEIIDQYANSMLKVLIIEGKPQEEIQKKASGNISFVTHMNDYELAETLLSAKSIICRSGYSTIMDLHALGCLEKASFVPTPGQTEQEYLYRKFSNQVEIIN